MAKQRATFGKLQRQRDKQAKAAAKRERRVERGGDEAQTDPSPRASDEEQEAVLSSLAALHAAYEDGGLSVEDFEARRDELRARLRVD